MLRRLTLFLLLFAGPLAAAPEVMVLSAGSPLPDMITSQLSISRMEAVCTLRGALARTAVTLTLALDAPAVENPPRMEAGLSFYLPPDCVITGASLDIGSILRRATLTFKETAEAAYRSVVSRRLDPVLITMAPDGMVKVQVFPITPGTPRLVQLEFSQILTPSPAGLIWEFPLRFPQPVAQASLTTDAPGLAEHVPSLRSGFSGGAEWTLTAPHPPANGLWPPQPDETGVYYFQGMLPPGTPVPAPRHLLLVAETSARQRNRDAASERRFLTEFMARMGEGTVTLATYDILPGTTREFQVKTGTCPGLFDALDALTYDGAPRPGWLKLAHIPADLTVITGSLQHPMDRQAWPDLPQKAPILVLDSVSSAPSTLALKLAGYSGGAVCNPRSPEPPVWFPRLPLAEGYFSDPTFYLLPDQSAWFVTAKLTGVTLTAPQPGKPPFPAKDNDPTAGQLTALHRSRDRLFRQMQDASGSLRHAPPPEWTTAPYLSDRTGFIVLEEPDQYTQFNIPLPPDLAGQDAGKNNRAGWELRTDFECLSRALTRAPSTPAGPEEWWQELSEWKFKSLSHDWHKLAEFQEHRSPMSAEERELEEYIGKDLYQTSVRNLEEAARQVPQLAGLYAAAENTAKASLVRRSRTLQQAKVVMMKIHNYASWDARNAPPADPFSGTSTGAGSSRGWGTGWGPRSLEGWGSTGKAALLQVSPDLREPAESRSLAAITAAAQALHREGRNAEALRILSNLAAQPQAGHGALRFFAWQLLEWNQRETAVYVLAQAEFLYGPTPTTQRDLALVRAGSAYPQSGDVETLHSLPLGVARREAAALQGRDSAALRLLLECADETADADLEIDGPDFETASWQNPLPTFGGALSFDGQGFTPEDFVLPSAPTTPLKVRVRLQSKKLAPVRLTVFRNWGQPGMTSQVFLLPACAPGSTNVVEIPAG